MPNQTAYEANANAKGRLSIKRETCKTKNSHTSHQQHQKHKYFKNNAKANLNKRNPS